MLAASQFLESPFQPLTDCSGSFSLPGYHRATSSAALFFITVVSVYVCACHGAEPEGLRSVSCYMCNFMDLTALPDSPWNCSKNHTPNTITIECTLFVDRCRTITIESGQACVAGVLLPISFDPEVPSTGLVGYATVGNGTPKKDCNLVMTEAEYSNAKVQIPCNCDSHLCNERLTITVVLPVPPTLTTNTFPFDTNDTAFGNTTDQFEAGLAGLSPSDYAAIALGSLELLLMIALAGLVCGLCYRIRQRRQLERRRLALMKRKFEPTPLHQ